MSEPSGSTKYNTQSHPNAPAHCDPCNYPVKSLGSQTILGSQFKNCPSA